MVGRVTSSRTGSRGGSRKGHERTAPGARVLLVDDKVEAVRGLTEILEHSGHEVRVVHDGEAALLAVRSDAPDVVLLDIGLPDMDGYEVARRMRADDRMRDTLLIALTGFSPDATPRAAVTCFDHYLVKPVDVHALQRLVADAGSRTRARG